MTAEFGGERRRRRIIILIALGLAVVAAIGTYSLASRPGGGPTPTGAVRTIVVAAVDIPARTQITQPMLATSNVPDSPAFRTAISDPTLAIGNVTVVNIVAGQAIQPSLYGTGNPGGVQILAPGETVAPDSPVWRAVSVSVPADRAVAALVNAGDHVDLIATMAIKVYGEDGQEATVPLPDGFVSGDSTKITLLDLQILNKAPDSNLYVLRVDESQAEEIAHIQAGGGSFTFALRPQADARDLDRSLYGETTGLILEQYGFRIPHAAVLPGTVPSPLPTPTPGETAAPTPGETAAPSP